MVRNKTLVLVCAVLAVGLFVLPSALSLFAGQHAFIGPSDVDCEKCHGAEAAEMAGAGENIPHHTLDCTDCHQTTAAGYDSIDQHASISPQCIVCHSGSGSKHSTGGDVATELLNDSHKEFYRDALISDLEEGGNEACIGCHTHIGVNITWERATTLTFVADHDPVTGWNITDFTAEGTNTTTTNYTSGY